MAASMALSSIDLEIEDDFEADDVSLTDPEPEARAEKPLLQHFVGIHVPPLTFPESAYDDTERRYPLSNESEAIEKLLSNDTTAKDQYAGADFISLCLEDFTVYRGEPDSGTHYGLLSLDQVALKQGGGTFYFDGVLRNNESDTQSLFYVEKVPFRLVSIGGYEDVEQHAVGEDIWIQSTRCQSKGTVWYRLGTPAAGYKEYHDAFTWVANLAKHFVDYLSEHEDATLEHFRSDFSTWLVGHHGTDTGFIEWHSKYGRADFRQAIMAHGNFLQRQSLNIDSRYGWYSIWREINLADPIVKQQPQKVGGTIVTPYIKECFKEMDWSHHLQAKGMDEATQAKHKARISQMGFHDSKNIPMDSIYQQRDISAPILDGADTIRLGDVIATGKDQATKWKGNGRLWYAVVQAIQTYDTRPARLSLIWLYHPSETVCANMLYPHSNELFMSDHCNCGDGNFDTTQVVKKVAVSFVSSRAKGKVDFFIRQTYSSSEETFTTLSEDHFYCPCRKPALTNGGYEKGDTVLIEVPDSTRLEPAEIVDFEGEKNVVVRTFLRRARDFKDSNCRPNELVYTDRMRTIRRNQIETRCEIRLYTQEEKENGLIPVPYNRDGTGKAFYIVVRECVENGMTLQPMTQPDDFKAGFDPNDDGGLEKLRALNLFCGGGSFDRGLEEGSAIQSEWAVEWEVAPMLTYRANHSRTKDKDKGLFCGSVNDYLAQGFKGKESIAQIGEVNFISGGSPCQGYSQANGKKSNETSLRNSSMIASVASFVDFYRPRYAILENVTQMAGRHHKKNPFSQLICAFVGMGYQVRILNLDAWNYGAPQSRSRLFIIVAAPGLHLPEHPFPTHSHPGTKRQQSLGEAPNGLPFGQRRFEIPVFDFITACEGTKDIPQIGMGRVTPVSWPDHRQSQGVSFARQKLMSSIPKAPVGLGLKDALARGFITPNGTLPAGKWKNPGRCWSRVGPNSLIPTVTTFVTPWCCFTGKWLHWDEERTLTVMEARRAQGFPDHEVLIGTPAQQWKVVGNSVARQVALALGLSVREACIRNRKAGLIPPVALPIKGSEMVSDTDAAGGQLFTKLGNLLVDREESEKSQQRMKFVVIDNRESRRKGKPRHDTPDMIIEETTTTTVTTTTRKTTRYSFSSKKIDDNSDSGLPVSRNKTPRKRRDVMVDDGSDSEPVSNGNKRKQNKTESFSLVQSSKKPRFANGSRRRSLCDPALVDNGESD